MRKLPKNNEVIEKIAKETGGTIVYSQEGRHVVKLKSYKVTFWLDYRPSRKDPYIIFASFCGLHNYQTYPTMIEQIKIAKNINKICDNLVNAFCAIIEKSLKDKDISSTLISKKAVKSSKKGSLKNSNNSVIKR